MTHLPESRPAYNDHLESNDGGWLDVRTHDGSLELLSVPIKVIEARGGFAWMSSGWPITHLLRLLGVDTSEGHCYRLRIESLDAEAQAQREESDEREPM